MSHCLGPRCADYADQSEPCYCSCDRCAATRPRPCASPRHALAVEIAEAAAAAHPEPGATCYSKSVRLDELLERWRGKDAIP